MRQWHSAIDNILVAALLFLTGVVPLVVFGVLLIGPIIGRFEVSSSGLRTIAEVQAAILAIVFSLSLFTMEQAASRYSSRIMAVYRRDRFTRILLASFVVNVVLALWTGSFQWDAQFAAQRLVFGIVLAWCSANLIALFPYYRHISAIVDPLELQARMHAEAARAVKEVDRQSLLRAIAAIGDIALGRVERGREQAIVESVLDNLQDVFVQFYALKATNQTSYENLFLSKELRELVARDPQGWQSAVFLGRVRCEPLGAILEQMSRLHKTAIHIGAGEVGRATAYRVIRILRRACGEEGNEMLVKQSVDEIRRLSLEAIKHQVPSMYTFGAHWYRDIIALGGLGGEFHMPYLPTISKTLFEINKVIVDEGAFDLFKEELSYLSTISLPDGALGDLRSVLDRYVRAVGGKLSQAGRHLRREMWALPLEATSALTPRYSPAGRAIFNARFVEALRLREELGLNPAELGEFEALESEIENAIDELVKVASTFETFFAVGAYCIFKDRFDFIREIWTHTRPEDADALWINRNLVFFNAPYLIWQVYAEPLLDMGYDFGGYHGSGTYLKRYLVLCLAECSSELALPPIPAHDDLKVWHYHTLTSFLGDIPSLKEVCDVLIAEEARLNPLFRGGARKALEKTKEYLEGMVSVCEQRQEEIVRSMAVEEKVEVIIRAILEEHAELSEVGRTAGVVDFDEQTHGALEFEEIRSRLSVDRLALTKLVGPPLIAGVTQHTRDRELFHLVTKIVLAAPEAREPARDPTVAQILEATRRFKQRNYQPQAILVPREMFTWLHTNMRPDYENGNLYIAVDEEARCRVIWTPDEWDIERMVVLSQDCGEWVRRRPFGIEVSGQEDMKIEFLMEEEICFDLQKVEALEVV